MLQRSSIPLLILLALLSRGAGAAAEVESPAATAEPATAAATAIEEPTPVVLSGTVRLPGDKAAAGATIRIIATALPHEPTNRAEKWKALRATLTVVKTREDGAFRASGLAGSVFKLRIEADGCAPTFLEDVEPGPPLDVNLSPGLGLVGGVRNRSDGSAVAGATIAACDLSARGFGDEACRTTVSGDDGRFELNGLGEGSHTLEAWSPRHARAQQNTVAVPQLTDHETGRVVPIDLFLAPGGRVAGTITDTDGAPVRYATVSLRAKDGAPQVWTRERPDLELTNEDGSFAFNGVRSGLDHELRVAATGYAQPLPIEVRLEPGDDLDQLGFTLTRGAMLKVRLVDEDERPVSGVQLTLTGDQHDDLDSAWGRSQTGPMKAGDDGWHTEENLRPGTVLLILAPDEHEEIARPGVVLKEGEVTDLGTLTVREGLSIGGRVTDEDDKPIASALIRASFQMDGRYRQRMTKTGADGRFRLAGLGVDAPSSVYVSAKGFVSDWRRDVETGRRDLHFTLQRAAAITGRVVLPDGSVPSRFQVKAHVEDDGHPDGQSRNARSAAGRNLEKSSTDPEGAFTLSGVPPGTYTVLAWATDWAPGRRPGTVVAAGAEIDLGTITLVAGLDVRGRVVNEARSAPVPGAAVTVGATKMSGYGAPPLARSTQADVRGEFVIRGLTAGSHELEATHPDFSPATARIELSEDAAPEEVVLTLTEGGRLEGTVFDADDVPVVGTRIMLTNGQTLQGSVFAVTGDDGRYAFERLSPGRYMALRMKEGSVIASMTSKSAAIVGGETTVLDFHQRKRIQMTGRVLRGDEPLAEASLMFIAAPEGAVITASPTISTAQSDADGSYSVGLDAPGKYQVMVSQRERNAFSAGHTVEMIVPDEPQIVRDIVTTAMGITGTVTDTDGKPIAGARVTARTQTEAPGELGGHSMAKSAADGRYVLSGLEAGTHEVTSWAQGYVRTEPTPVTLTDRGETLDFTLSRGRVLRGRVVDPGGRPVSNAWISAEPAGSPATSFSGSARSDINGTFSIVAPGDGAVDVSAVARGWAIGVSRGVVPAGDTAEMDVVVALTRGGTVVVTVLGADDKPRSGITVFARAETPSALTMFARLNSPSVPSDADGRVRLSALAPGNYSIGCLDCTATAPATVSVSEGDEINVVLRLPPRP